jgi:hypothetical protein
MLKLEQAACQRCVRCNSPLCKAGYIAEDNQGVRQFVCCAHLTELLFALCQPVPMGRRPKRSVDPQLLTAEVVGYQAGLGSLIELEK